MERVAKRFLLHNKREREDVKESDFEELKQDMQMIRHELNNDVTLFSVNLINYTAMLHRGICMLGEFFYCRSDEAANEVSTRFKHFQSHMAYFHNELGNKENSYSIGSTEDQEKGLQKRQSQQLEIKN